MPPIWQRGHTGGVDRTSQSSTTDWHLLVAIGALSDDLSPSTIARYAGVTIAEANRAIETAARHGMLDDGALTPATRAELIGTLDPERVAELHASIARHLLAQGPSRLQEALEHARTAAGLAVFEDLIGLAEHAAMTSLSFADYESARALFELADELGSLDSAINRARRLLGLSVALSGLGLVQEARNILGHAFDLAETARDAALATEIAAAYAQPADWYAGDLRASALLQRAEAMEPGPEGLVALAAARSMVEMRIPVAPANHQQLGWITRASVAQPLSDKALTASIDCSSETRLLALLAWRSTHRSPHFLARRREVSREAMDLAQRLRRPSQQGDAAVMLAVDALESADRPQFDEALGVLRWIAERDGNPRLSWYAHAVAAGAANIDGNIDEARAYRTRAREIGVSINFPGWLGADLLLLAREILDRADHDEIAAHILPDSAAEMASPLAKFVVAQGEAIIGRSDDAERRLRRGILRLDEEASYLLGLTRAAVVAVELGLPDVISMLTEKLRPWHEHIAVDANAWWCDGPVSLALASLAIASNDERNAVPLLVEAEAVAKRTGDVYSLERIERLQRKIPTGVGAPFTDQPLLTEREHAVLRLLVDGLSNREIAAALNFSPSTIRNDATAIYRKLDVAGRPQAAARAIALNLL